MRWQIILVHNLTDYGDRIDTDFHSYIFDSVCPAREKINILVAIVLKSKPVGWRIRGHWINNIALFAVITVFLERNDCLVTVSLTLTLNKSSLWYRRASDNYLFGRGETFWTPRSWRWVISINDRNRYSYRSWSAWSCRTCKGVSEWLLIDVIIIESEWASFWIESNQISALIMVLDLAPHKERVVITHRACGELCQEIRNITLIWASTVIRIESHLTKCDTSIRSSDSRIVSHTNIVHF